MLGLVDMSMQRALGYWGLKIRDWNVAKDLEYRKMYWGLKIRG